jgi:hypothetical protein
MAIDLEISSPMAVLATLELPATIVTFILHNFDLITIHF